MYYTKTSLMLLLVAVACLCALESRVASAECLVMPLPVENREACGSSDVYCVNGTYCNDNYCQFNNPTMCVSDLQCSPLFCMPLYATEVTPTQPSVTYIAAYYCNTKLGSQPGMECASATDCRSNLSTCAKSNALSAVLTCNNANSTCYSDYDCTFGHYCNLGACAAQGGSGAACTGAVQCQGNLVCSGGVCTAPFQVKSGGQCEGDSRKMFVTDCDISEALVCDSTSHSCQPFTNKTQCDACDLSECGTCMCQDNSDPTGPGYCVYSQFYNNDSISLVSSLYQCADGGNCQLYGDYIFNPSSCVVDNCLTELCQVLDVFRWKQENLNSAYFRKIFTLCSLYQRQDGAEVCNAPTPTIQSTYSLAPQFSPNWPLTLSLSLLISLSILLSFK